MTQGDIAKGTLAVFAYYLLENSAEEESQKLILAGLYYPLVSALRMPASISYNCCVVCHRLNWLVVDSAKVNWVCQIRLHDRRNR
jgi:hypothetical protein